MPKSRNERLLDTIRLVIGETDENENEAYDGGAATAPNSSEAGMTPERKRQAIAETVEYALAQERLAARRAKSH